LKRILSIQKSISLPKKEVFSSPPLRACPEQKLQEGRGEEFIKRIEY